MSETKIVMLAPEQLVPHPQNPRGEIMAADVADLRASIAANGQRQPCLVRPRAFHGKVVREFRTGEVSEYEIILGRRRALCNLLDKREVPCIVADLSDDDALKIMVSEQATKADPDPILEAEAVAALLARPGWTLQAAADALGKSVKWVAQRANLRTLIPEIAELRRDPKSRVADFPISWLEDIAKLSPETQKAEVLGELKATWSDFDRTTLNDILQEQLQVLGDAPWKLDDATLVPKAGPCTSCPKTSARSPGLFDEEDLDPARPEDLAKARCRDSFCWSDKAEAYKLLQIKKVDAKHVIKGHGSAKAPKGVTAVEAWRVEKAKKTDPRAVPAVVLDGKDAGKVQYIIPPGAPAKPAKTSAPANGEKKPAGSPARAHEGAAELAGRLKDSKEKIRRRRMAHVVDAVREAIEKDEAPTCDDVIHGLVAAYGCRGPMSGTQYDYEMHTDPAPAKRKKAYEAGETGGVPLQQAVWPRLKKPIVDTLKRYNADKLEEEYAAAIWLAEVLAFDPAKLEAQAKTEIPNPKWWAGAEESKKSTPAPAAPQAISVPLKATRNLGESLKEILSDWNRPARAGELVPELERRGVKIEGDEGKPNGKTVVVAIALQKTEGIQRVGGGLFAIKPLKNTKAKATKS